MNFRYCNFLQYLEEDETDYFFNVTLPAITKLALALPQLIQSPIPLLRRYKNRSVSLTQEQISSLLANAFFCTFPRRNSSKRTSEYSKYPHINFNGLYESSTTPSIMEKLKCICHYFRRVCTKENHKSTDMESWRGAPITDIYGSASPWGAPEFPLVSPAYNHAVLYHVGRSGHTPGDKPPSPQRGHDKWDQDYVKMPCSSQSLYLVPEEDGNGSPVRRWDIIKSALQRPIRNSEELAEAICSYNTRFKDQWKFRALHHLFNEYLEEDETDYFFNVTLPAITKLALALPQLIQSPIPLLRRYKNRSVSLTQEQISSLLANAFFCTFPRRNSSKRTSEYSKYPHINFNGLYESSTTPSIMEKLKCICHYFRRVCTKVPVGVLTFTRRTVDPVNCPEWRKSSRLIGSIPLHVNSNGTIEDDGIGLIQIDFANKYLGGGVLNHGCVQEEIRFVVCPELMVSMLFTEMLHSTEALFIIGCERYSSYTGYGSTFEWSGSYEDDTPRDSSGRRRCTVLAIDALPFSQERDQLQLDDMIRELNKAWVGVSAYSSPLDESPLIRPGVATGNWGCGAFGGTPELKSLFQLMACAVARRPVAYYTFGDVALRNDIIQMYNFLSQHHVTVGQLFKYLVKFSRSHVSLQDLYPFIYQQHNDDNRPVTPESTSHQPEDSPGKVNVAALARCGSPDIFSSGNMSSLSEPFVDLEKGEGTLHVNVDAASIASKQVTEQNPHEHSNSEMEQSTHRNRIENHKSTDMESWRGAPITDIYGSASPWGAPEFPLVSPAYNHAVLYHVGRSGHTPGDKPPSPQRGHDKWDQDYVKMPCSSQSLYLVPEEDGNGSPVRRWDIIKSALQRPIRNSEELAEAICSYNTRFKDQWKFRALHHLFNEYLEEDETDYFFNVTLPAITKLALALPQLIQSPIPLLRRYKNRSVSLTQEQISSLLANAFFCTFPRRNSSKRTSEYSKYPHINFNGLYESSTTPSIMEKLKCICHYFRRVCTKVPVGVLTFTRRTVDPVNCPEWRKSSRLIGSIPLHVNSNGTIEDDGIGLIQIDFANKYLGGGVLNHGCVQEEIRFVVCPELMVSMLFTEMLHSTEALFIIGCERYSSYTGYGSTFEWSGSYEDDTPRDSSGRRRCTVLAIDALPFSQERDQLQLDDMIRELNKAWVGVSAYSSPLDESPLIRPGVATGNWGCGAFGGTPELKSLFQLMACAVARRPVAYYTFGDVALRNDIIQMYNFLSQHHVTVGQLFKYLVKFSRSHVSLQDLYPFIYQQHNDDNRPVTPESTSHQPEDSPGKVNVAALARCGSPDIFSSGNMSSLSEPFVDLEKGEGTLHVNVDAASIASKQVTEQNPHEHSNSEMEQSISTHDTPSAQSASKSAHDKTKTVMDTSKLVQHSKPATDSSAETRQTASLFDDITKFDQANSMLNFNKSSTSSPFRCEDPIKRVDSAMSVSPADDLSESESSVAAPGEKAEGDKGGAKKMARKITDYFNKKF